MKKLSIVLSILCISLSLFAVPPTTPTTNLSLSNVEGNSMYLYFTRGDGSSRIAILRQGSPVTAIPQNGTSYLASSVFGNGQEIAPGEFVVYNGSGSAFGISNLVPETEYYIAFFEVNGSGINSEFLTTTFLAESVSTIAEPSLQPSNFAVSEITGNALKLSWSPGNGDNRIVLARRGGPVNANPVELTSYRANDRVEYRGSNSGSVIGDNNFVVYKGTGSSVSLSDMFPDTTYHFAVFEYNGNSGPVYLTTNPLRGIALMLPQPTIPSSDIIVSQVEGDRFSLRWTEGNGTRRIVVIREGTPITALPEKNVSYGFNSDFLLAPEIAPGHKVMYDNVNSTTTVRNLTLGKTYYIAIFEYSGSGTHVGYLTSTYATISQATQAIPTVNVTNLDSAFVEAYRADIIFTPGNGTTRLVVMKKGAPVDFVPSNYTNYNANSDFGSGNAHVGNENYVVYKGNGNEVTVRLQPNETYHVAAFEFNGTNYPAFNVSDVDTFSFSTKLPPPPTIPARNLSFSSVEGNSMRMAWLRGDGERRIVIARLGGPVTAVPQNGVQYTNANKAFNLAPEIEPGQKVIYDGTGYYADLDSLEIGSDYHIQVIEYNGTNTITNYLRTDILSGYAFTKFVPSVSASNVYFELQTLDKLRLFWKKGSGTKRIVLARKNAPVDDEPEQLKTYNASSNFGSGSSIGQSTVVSNYVGNYVSNDTVYADINNLEPGNTYYFKVFEYNGSSAPVYKQTDPAAGSFYISFEPRIPSTNFRATSTDGNALRIQWTRGSGDNRVIIAREGQPVDVVPLDGVAYTAQKDFRIAAEIAPGQKVIYNGNSYSTNSEGLNPATTYYFKIFEYGGTGANINYLTSVYDSTSADTKSAPTIQVSSVVVSNITPESGNISWTNGNGERHMIVAKKGGPVSVEPRDTTTYSGGYFGQGTALGDGNFVLYKNNLSNHSMQRLESGTTYHLAVYEYNGVSGPVILRPGSTQFFTTLGPPQQNALGGITTEITDNSMHINFTKGSGQKRIVVMRQSGAVDAAPVDDVNYIDNSFFGAGDEIGTGNFVVYDGEDNNIIVTGLLPSTTYYFTIFEYNAFSGGTILNYLRPSTATASAITLGPLPLTWLSFSGVLDERKTILNWSTASEHNNSHFIIERSVDGRSFLQIGKISGQGNAVQTQNYIYKDLLPDDILYSNQNLYYRIRQIDLDGKFTYSKVISLKLLSEKNIKIYPNPVKPGGMPGVYIKSGENVQAYIYSMSGQLITKQQLKNGYNVLKIINRSAGTYLLRLQYADGKSKTVRIVME